MISYLVTKAYAEVQDGTGGSRFDQLLKDISDEIISPIIYILISLSLIYFLWGVFIFVKNSDNPTEREVGYQHMFWGIVGLFVMIAVNGIISLIDNTVNSI